MQLLTLPTGQGLCTPPPMSLAACRREVPRIRRQASGVAIPREGTWLASTQRPPLAIPGRRSRPCSSADDSEGAAGAPVRTPSS